MMNNLPKISQIRIIKIAKSPINSDFGDFICYQEYEADKKKRLGEEGAKPRRIRYKPISR